MSSSTTRAPSKNRADWPQVVFSLHDARRALAYVVRIVRDATESYHEIQRCRRHLAQSTSSREAALLADRRDRSLERLNAATDECNAVGADLIDLRLGVVRFSARVNDRAVSLIWRLGDDVASAWAELDVESEPHEPASAS